MATATALSSLKFTNAKKSNQLSPVQSRRNKIVAKLEEQIALATAQAEGRVYAPAKFKTVTDASGERRSVETTKRLKQWWFAAADGKLALTVRYGAKVLELAKGKNAVDVGTTAQLVPVLTLLKQAAQDGELDAAIEAAGAALRKGFGKGTDR